MCLHTIVIINSVHRVLLVLYNLKE